MTILTNIGNPDPALREAAYTNYNQALADIALSQRELKEILQTCISDQYLFYGIGERESDTVFTRTFSALFIAGVIDMHNENPFLTDDGLQATMEAAKEYISQEMDFRGYVVGKGWAHAAAHIADVFAMLSKTQQPWEVLNALKSLVLNPHAIYTAEEEDRITSAVLSVLHWHQISDEQLLEWVESFDPTGKMWWGGNLPTDFNVHVNRKLFMRSFYFRLDEDSSKLNSREKVKGFIAGKYK